MGYTTTFQGRFNLDEPLMLEQAAYLTRFAEMRRMKRIQLMLNEIDDPVREAVKLPIGIEGEYFTGSEAECGQDFDHPSVLDDSEPPSTQPSLWCGWMPTKDCRGIEWNGWEKFYCYEAWLYYLIQNFLRPWGYRLNGTVKWQGERRTDGGMIRVENNDILDFDPRLECEFSE